MPAAVFTSVANWSTSGLKDIEWRGEKYLWSKSREFLRFVAAPKKAGETFELATDIKDDENPRTNSCATAGASAPRTTSAPIIALYRDYIRRSKGEFTVAKDQYVRLNTGWFSDRSACYLAAGRPVITQETGVHAKIPSKHGLLTFRSLSEIAEAVRVINADYRRHSRAAREIWPAKFSKRRRCCVHCSIAPASKGQQLVRCLARHMPATTVISLRTDTKLAGQSGWNLISSRFI